MSAKGKIWDKPPLSGGPFRHYPPGGTTTDPLPAYTQSDNPNVSSDLKPEGNNDDAVARMHGLPGHKDFPLTKPRLTALQSFVRAKGVRWRKSRFTHKWYADDQPLLGFPSEVDLLLYITSQLQRCEP